MHYPLACRQSRLQTTLGVERIHLPALISLGRASIMSTQKALTEAHTDHKVVHRERCKDADAIFANGTCLRS